MQLLLLDISVNESRALTSSDLSTLRPLMPGATLLRNLITIPARADERLKRTQPIKADGNGVSDFIKEKAHELGEEAPKS